MIRLWNYLVTSSADPRAFSLSIKGVLVLLIPKIISLLAIICMIGYCWHIDPQGLNEIVNFIVKAVEIFLWIVGGVMTLIGLARKLDLGRWSHPAATLE